MHATPRHAAACSLRTIHRAGRRPDTCQAQLRAANYCHCSSTMLPLARHSGGRGRFASVRRVETIGNVWGQQPKGSHGRQRDRQVTDRTVAVDGAELTAEADSRNTSVPFFYLFIYLLPGEPRTLQLAAAEAEPCDAVRQERNGTERERESYLGCMRRPTSGLR
jgi:hypothetical protein